jgi:hypothetical protein
VQRQSAATPPKRAPARRSMLSAGAAPPRKAPGRLQEQGAAAAPLRAAPGRLQRQGAAATPPRTAPDRLQRHQQDAPAIARLCLLNPDPTPIYPGHQFGHVCSSFSIVLREIFFCYTFCMGNALDPRSPIQPTLAVAGRSGT